jgi:hypothetical protein
VKFGVVDVGAHGEGAFETLEAPLQVGAAAVEVGLFQQAVGGEEQLVEFAGIKFSFAEGK